MLLLPLELFLEVLDISRNLSKLLGDLRILDHFGGQVGFVLDFLDGLALRKLGNWHRDILRFLSFLYSVGSHYSISTRSLALLLHNHLWRHGLLNLCIDPSKSVSRDVGLCIDHAVDISLKIFALTKLLLHEIVHRSHFSAVDIQLLRLDISPLFTLK